MKRLIQLENLKPLIHGQINLTHFLNQKIVDQIRCLHDQISLKQTNKINFNEMGPFQPAEVIQLSSTFLLSENFLSSLE